MRFRLHEFIVAALLAVGLSSAGVAQVVRSGSGAAATTARDTFRTDLGGGTIAGANGSFGGVRREINWDGVPASLADPNNLPATFFDVNSPRGVVFSTPGTGFQVSAAAGDVTPIAFSRSDIFTAFSPQRLFTPIGSNIFDVSFFLPGTSTVALTSGFGAIFADVDLANTTFFELFAGDNSSLGTFFVPVSGIANGGFSFLGVSYGAPTISRVRVTLGNAVLTSAAESSSSDFVVVDDFLFGEPIAGAVPEPATWAMMLLGFGAIGMTIRRSKRRGRATMQHA